MLDPKNIVYIFHKNIAISHYLALNQLLDKKGMILEYRAFSIISKAINNLSSYWQYRFKNLKKS